MFSYGMDFQIPYPGYFIFLLDQSGAMSRRFGGVGRSKSDMLADHLNSWIEDMLVAASRSSGIREYMDVSVIGYTTDQDSNPIIKSALTGPLAGRERVGIAEFAENVVREEQRLQPIFDEETGETLEIPTTQRIWVEPQASCGAPMSSAFIKAYELADEWTQQNPNCFPPIVINFSGGKSTEGYPQDYADPLMSISTCDGLVLLCNVIISESKADKLCFPSTRLQVEETGNPNAEQLFNISSELPTNLLETGRRLGFNLRENARCMSYLSTSNPSRNLASEIFYMINPWAH